MNIVTDSIWYDFQAVSIESERLRVKIVPELGAKIVSLLDKITQHEWLVPPMRTPRQTAYGMDFVSQDMSGWDEMMPTISACDWQGHTLPDHGEVWSIPWQMVSRDGEVSLRVDGTALPYRLERSAVFSSEACLELRYTLTHTGAEPFPYLWAAHPQFAADAQTRLILPAEVSQVVNVIDGDNLWGRAGELHDWPRSAMGFNLDRVRAAAMRACRKFYLLPERPVGSALLVHEGLECSLNLEWDTKDLPYLGIWVDEGYCNSKPVVAPEPATGYYDSLTRAVNNAKVPWLQPGEVKKWVLKIVLNAQK